jgi:orotate phosphoribosyltransferase-like protein
VNPDLWKRMIELRNRNLTYVQIADKLNLSDTTVRKYLIEYGEDGTHKGG